MPKRYDRAYFDHWYRRRRIGSAADLDRIVALAVAITEHVLGRPIRTVLDVGAGEGRWYPVLRRLRPRAAYTGVDSSRWAVRKWGPRRHLRQGSIDRLDQLDLDPPYDLIVVADVLHYLPTGTIRTGMRQVLELLDGVAFLPTFTRHDAIEGDHAGFERRAAAEYRRIFREAGLVELGMYAWTTRARAKELAALERPG